MRRRDVLKGVGATLILGCDRVVQPTSGAPAPIPPLSPTQPAPIEAPGITRSRRGDRIALGGAGLGQLRERALLVRGEDGVLHLELPMEATYGLAGLPDGALLALGRVDGVDVAMRVSAQRVVERHPVLVITGEDPVGVLPEPGASDAFWILSPDRTRAWRTSLMERYGRLDVLVARELDNPGRGDVVPLRGGALLQAVIGGLQVVDASGQVHPVPWSTAQTLERVSPGPEGSAWALALDGQLTRVDLAGGAVLAERAIPGQGVALSSDDQGVAAITAQRATGGELSWTLTVLDTHGRELFQHTEQGESPRSLTLSSHVVVAGDAARLRVLGRADGRLRFSEG